MNILIYIDSSNVGDILRHFCLIVNLKKMYKDSVILVMLPSMNNLFGTLLKEYNLGVNFLSNDVVFRERFKWSNFISRETLPKITEDDIDLIIDTNSRYKTSMVLLQIPTNLFYASTWKFMFCSKRLNYVKAKNNPTLIAKNIGLLTGNKLFSNSKYNIAQIDNKLQEEALRLLPNNNYIGFAVTQGHPFRKKSWSIENFIIVANKISEQGCTPVFLIEPKYSELIKRIKKEVAGVIIPETETNMGCPALVTLLASRLKKAITIDCGVMHMIALANTPMIVLFGPTNAQKFMPKIDHVDILDAKVLYDTDDIDEIKVEDVMACL